MVDMSSITLRLIRGYISQYIENALWTCDGRMLRWYRRANFTVNAYNGTSVLMNYFTALFVGRHKNLSVPKDISFPCWLLSGLETQISAPLQQRKRRQRLSSPFLPLFLVALHVWSDLLGEPLVLSELGLSITCSAFCKTERERGGKKWVSYNDRNKQQAGMRLSNTTCGWLRTDQEGTLLLLPPSSLKDPLVIIFSPEV